MTTNHGARWGIGFLLLLAACSGGRAAKSDAATHAAGGTADAANSVRPEGGFSAAGGAAQGDLGSEGAVAAGGAIGGSSGSGGTSSTDGASVDSSQVDLPQDDLPQDDALEADAPQVDVPLEIDAPVDGEMDDGEMDAANTAFDGAIDSADSPIEARNTCVGPVTAALANAAVPAGYCAWTWASGLASPRGILRNANGDLLVVEQAAGRISLLFDDDGNGLSDANERVTLTTTVGLNHGIAMRDGYLYASSDSTVYRWPYAGGRTALGAPQTVVSGLPAGGHSTRTLLFDGDGRLYVAIGSGSNVDGDSSRAKLIRFAANALGGGATYGQGEVFAEGMRNEVGITLDSQGRVWGVENGVDDLNRADLGGDIHNDNPGEELNLFANPGLFYGYPYCWSEFLLPASVGIGPGTQWAHPQFLGDGIHTDTWCRNTANVVPPVLSMQAHSAPLDIKFYRGGAFPGDMTGSAIISFHGSWDRTAATGYKVVRVPFGANGMPSGGPVPLLEYAGAGDTGSGWPHRPVGIETGVDGRLFVSSDASGVIIAIGYNGG